MRLFIILLLTHSLCFSQNEKVYSLFEVNVPPVLIGYKIEQKLDPKKDFEHSVLEFVQKNISIITGQKTSFEKAFVEIIIDETGNSSISNHRATSRKAEKEALKTIKKLPKFIPAKFDGRPVKMRFVIPITFNIIVLN